MTETLIRYERTFWRLGAIRVRNGRRVLLTNRVPGPMLLAYRVAGGEL